MERHPLSHENTPMNPAAIRIKPEELSRNMLSGHPGEGEPQSQFQREDTNNERVDHSNSTPRVIKKSSLGQRGKDPYPALSAAAPAAVGKIIAPAVPSADPIPIAVTCRCFGSSIVRTFITFFCC